MTVHVKEEERKERDSGCEGNRMRRPEKFLATQDSNQTEELTRWRATPNERAESPRLLPGKRTKSRSAIDDDSTMGEIGGARPSNWMNTQIE